MAAIVGTRYSDTDTQNIGIDMSDTLYMISPFDVPLLQLVGKDSLSTPCVAVMHTWLEDNLRSLDSTVVTLGQLASGDVALSTTTCTANTGAQFRIGDVVLVTSAAGTELIHLTSAMNTDTFVVANQSGGGRGYGGSTPLSHTGLPTLQIIGNTNLQNAAVGGARSTSKVIRTNYTQIYEDAITVTSTLQAIKKYVEQDEMSAQLERALKVAWVQYERTLLNGRKIATTATVAGAMDGILPVVATSGNTYAKSGAALTEAFLWTALRDCWAAGGKPDKVFTNSFQKSQMNKFLDSMRMTTRTDRVAGAIVDTYSSDFGTVDIVLDRNMPADTVLVIESGRIGFGPLRDHALKVVDIAQTTGLVLPVKQLIGQYTSETRNPTAHASITGLSTS